MHERIAQWPLHLPRGYDFFPTVFKKTSRAEVNRVFRHIENSGLIKDQNPTEKLKYKYMCMYHKKLY